VQMFVERHAEAATQLQELIDTGEVETAERLAHTLKGAAGSIGAVRIAHRASELNIALRQGDLATARPCLPQLLDELAALCRAVLALPPAE